MTRGRFNDHRRRLCQPGPHTFVGLRDCQWIRKQADLRRESDEREHNDPREAHHVGANQRLIKPATRMVIPRAISAVVHRADQTLAHTSFKYSSVILDHFVVLKFPSHL